MSWITLTLLCGELAAGEPSPIRGIVSAVPVTLATPYRSDWSAERPEVSAGTVLTLDIDPAALVLRNGPSPVLYVGAAPAEVLRRDVEAGRLVVLVPAALGPEVAVYFGGEALPETVTAAAGAEELAKALAGGLVPMRLPAVEAVRVVKDRVELEGI